MPINQKFLIVKNKDEKEIKYFEYDKVKGYNIAPKNKVKFEDAINVNRMILINPSLINKMVDKKVKRRFAYLVNMISFVCENDDESGDGLYLALDQAEKFRMELLNKYKKYIEEEKFALLLKKIAILEDELKLRIKYNTKSYEDTRGLEGKSR